MIDLKPDSVLTVKFSGLLKLPVFNQGERGCLAVAEVAKQIPFPLKRFYVISGVQSVSLVRGGHAHKSFQQAIFVLAGSFDLLLDDGEQKQNFRLSDPSLGLVLGPGLWHELKNISPDAVILVVSDSWFDEGDYLRAYAAFIAWQTKVDD